MKILKCILAVQLLLAWPWIITLLCVPGSETNLFLYFLMSLPFHLFTGLLSSVFFFRQRANRRIACFVFFLPLLVFTLALLQQGTSISAPIPYLFYHTLLIAPLLALPLLVLFAPRAVVGHIPSGAFSSKTLYVLLGTLLICILAAQISIVVGWLHILTKDRDGIAFALAVLVSCLLFLLASCIWLFAYLSLFAQNESAPGKYRYSLFALSSVMFLSYAAVFLLGTQFFKYFP